MGAELAWFGSALRRQRLAAGLTQEELAERAGLSVRGIQDLERGARRFPRPDTLRRLTAALRHQERVLGGEALGNLQLPWTRFIGRAAELAHVRELLSSERLVTLTGAGGIGKTRLAMEAAAGLHGSHPEGVWLVELATLTEPALVPQAVGALLGMRPTNQAPWQQVLIEFLRHKQLLLVLDNCEHLLTAAATLAEAVLRGCPRVCILATSREPLRISGEVAWRVPSLSLPTSAASVSVEQLLEYEATRLFVERIPADAPFELTERSAPAVARLCQRLDGIPLALELAAARAKVLAIEQIATRLDDRFRLLVGGDRTAPRRHQTLQATIDWSYDLLNPAEQGLLCQLSVFAGDWTIEAAESVCLGPDLAAVDVLQLLGNLVDKSLVLAEPGFDGQMRFGFLESMRVYAQERLQQDPQRALAVLRRHCAYYSGLAEEVESHVFWGADEVAWQERLEHEQGNLRAGLGWSLSEAGDAQAALALVGHLGHYWYTRGDRTEGRAWLNRALARASETISAWTPPVRSAWAWALLWAGGLAHGQSDYDEAVTLLKQAELAFEDLDDRRGIGWALSFQGHVARARAELQQAAVLLERAVDAFRAIGDELSMVSPLAALGFTVAGLGDQDRALRLLEESVAVARRRESSGRLAIASIYLGQVAYAGGDTARATAALQEGLQLSRGWDSAWGTAECLEGLALIAAAEGQGDRAARLLAAAARLRESIGAPAHPVDRADLDRALARIQATCGAQAFDGAWAAGLAMTSEEVIAYATSTTA